MDDLISRQAAIEALGEEPPVWYDGEDEIAERNQWRRDVAAIKALPSAQPDLSSYSDKLWRNAYERGKAEAEAEIIRCKNCKWFYEGKWCVRYMYALLPEDFCSYAERRTE